MRLNMNNDFSMVTIESNVDNHNHSTGSDGKQSPLRVLIRTAKSFKNIMSITDHDSVSGYKELEDYMQTVVGKTKADEGYNPRALVDTLKSIKLIPGAELITSYNGVIIEVLGYGIDVDTMAEEIKNLKKTVSKKPYEKLYEAFSKKIDELGLVFDKTKLDEAFNRIKETGRGGVAGPFYEELMKHPENEKLLKYEENGEIKMADTLKLFLNKHLYKAGSPFFVDMAETRPKYKDTIDAIHKAGGQAILAHPGRYMDKFDVLANLDDMISYGLDGLEVFYPDHPYELRQKLLTKAREHNIKVSGGSDDHNDIKYVNGRATSYRYETGIVAIPDLPETKWIPELAEKDNFLQRSEKVRTAIQELEQIADKREEKDEER